MCTNQYSNAMTSSTITVRIDGSAKKRLEKLAKSTGRSRSFLAAEAINDYLNVNEWQVAGIKQAIASLDADGGIPHEEVEKWVRSWGKRNKLPKPTRARS
jgi:predicted transcriptional regulator